MKRYNRQKLKAHDQGNDRHHKVLSFLKKRQRLQEQKAREATQKRMR